MMNNYIKIFLIFITVAVSNSFYCQAGNVGINTDNPQQKLHISGNSTLLDNNIGTTGVALISPTVRIDGLNSTVNPTVFSAVDTANPLYINNLGITSVIKGVTSSSYSAPGSDAIATTTTLTVTGAGVYNSTGNLMSASFTLAQRSMVFISSSLSLDVRNLSNGNITDGHARGLLAFLFFSAAPTDSGIVLGSGFVSDGATFFSNGAGINTLKLSPGTELVLPAGSYTLSLRGAGISADANDNFNIIFGGGSGDKLNVLIKPL